MPFILNKFSQEHFNEYARVVGQALAAFPDPVLVSNKNISPYTLAEYIRRAIRAKVLHGWRHSHVDEGLWALHGQKLTCQICEEGVRIGDRRKLRAENMPSVMVPSKNLHIFIETREIHFLDLVCNLQAERVLNPAPVFVAFMTPEIATELQKRHDEIVIEETKTLGQYQIL